MKIINSIFEYLTQIDPVIIHLIGPLSLRWYSLSYVFGLIIVHYFLLSNLQNIMKKQEIESLMNYIIVGLIIGARLGFILLYDPLYYINNPISIFKIWEGGLAFHGGVGGIAIGILLFVKKNTSFSFFQITDVGLVVAPIGIFFGRISNFINAELFGRPTKTGFGVIFRTDPLKIKRYPTQIFEALTEGVLLFIILYIFKKRIKIARKRGLVTALFLILYSFFRFLIEFIKEPDPNTGIILKYFTLGHFYSIITMFMGFYILYLNFKKKNEIHSK